MSPNSLTHRVFQMNHIAELSEVISLARCAEKDGEDVYSFSSHLFLQVILDAQVTIRDDHGLLIFALQD